MTTTTLIIRVSDRNGVEDVTAQGVRSVAQASRVGRLSSAIALPLSLLDRAIKEFAEKEAKA
jgi:hypothetical protein